MPILLMLASLLFASCKKENQILPPAINAYSSSYSVLDGDHEVNRSIILNSLVDDKMKLNLLSDTDKKDHSLETTVIVSYSDREEVHHIPKNIELKNVISYLGLEREEGRDFQWKKNDVVRTYEGLTLYLVSLNLNDLVENDQKYFSQSLVGSKIKTLKGQKVVLDIHYQAYQQTKIEKTMTSTNIRCSADTREEGCGECTYQQVTAGDFAPVSNPQYIEINLKQNTVVKTVRLDQVSEQAYSTILDGGDIIEVSEMVAPAYIETFFGHNYSAFCRNRNVSTNVLFQGKLEVDVRAKVLGRGEEFLKGFMAL